MSPPGYLCIYLSVFCSYLFAQCLGRVEGASDPLAGIQTISLQEQQMLVTAELSFFFPIFLHLIIIYLCVLRSEDNFQEQ